MKFFTGKNKQDCLDNIPNKGVREFSLDNERLLQDLADKFIDKAQTKESTSMLSQSVVMPISEKINENLQTTADEFITDTLKNGNETIASAESISPTEITSIVSNPAMTRNAGINMDQTAVKSKISQNTVRISLDMANNPIDVQKQFTATSENEVISPFLNLNNHRRPPKILSLPQTDEDKTFNKPDLSTNKAIFKKIFASIKTACLLFVVALLFNNFILQRNEVSGDSMQPNLYAGDQILVNMLGPRLGLLEVGDIIVLNSDNISEPVQIGDLLKRIVAVGGDKVEIIDDKIYINDQILKEEYLAENTITEPVDLRYQKVVLALDQYYVLGDNRQKSLDSRFFGPIRKSDIRGEYWLRIYSQNKPLQPTNK